MELTKRPKPCILLLYLLALRSIPQSNKLSYRADSGDLISASGSPDLVSRVDFGRFDGSRVSRTPQGGLKVPAALTREGVFTYRNTDGTVRREYRPADEVFKADALASLEDAPVTDLHPSTMVDASNHGVLSKGHVRDIKRDGQYVAATMLVQDKALIEAIESGARKEISCGYTCKLDMTPGISPQGEAYDAIQRGITYNHAALLPIGAGRAGRDVALRLDAAFQDVSQTPADKPAEKVTITVKTIRIDGKDYVVGSDEHLAKLDEMKATELKAATDRAVKAEAERDAARADAADARDPVKQAARAAARTALETAARKVLGTEVKLDGMSDDEVRAATVAKGRPEVKLDGLSAEARPVYLAAHFDALTSGPVVETGSMADAARAANAAAGSVSTASAKPTHLTGWVAPPLAISKK